MIDVRESVIKLISHTEDPIETILAVWVQSRPSQFPRVFEWLDDVHPCSKGVVTASNIRTLRSQGSKAVWRAAWDELNVEETVKTIIKMNLPISESISFTWGFSNLPIEWREQAVRKRQWGFWLTSMREFSMENFAKDGRVSLRGTDVVSVETQEQIKEYLLEIDAMYSHLINDLGCPAEIARKVIPLCATHNGTMFSNFRTLMDTLSARSCFIAQISLWDPVLTGMVSELKEVDPLFGKLISPPCFDRFSNEYKGCKYCGINENRLTEADPYAPCPLYCQYEELPPGVLDYEPLSNYDAWLAVMGSCGTASKYVSQGKSLLSTWESLWGRDPHTGELK